MAERAERVVARRARIEIVRVDRRVLDRRTGAVDLVDHDLVLGVQEGLACLWKVDLELYFGEIRSVVKDVDRDRSVRLNVQARPRDFRVAALLIGQFEIVRIGDEKNGERNGWRLLRGSVIRALVLESDRSGKRGRFRVSAGAAQGSFQIERLARPEVDIGGRSD